MTLPISSSTTTSLWDQAFNLLNSESKASLNLTKMHKRDILAAVLKEVEAKRLLAAKNRWKFKKPNGRVIIVRDVLEKIARWIDRVKSVNDAVVSHDAAHLALPWTAFKFLLHTGDSNSKIVGALANDLETIARVVVRFCEFERLHLHGTNSKLELILEEPLTTLYEAILTHLAHKVKILNKECLARSLKSPSCMIDGEQMQKILDLEAEVLKTARMTGTDKRMYAGTAIVRLSNQPAGYTRSLSEQKYNDIIRWLLMSPCRNHHQFISQPRLPGLGEWLLKHEDYIDWQTSSSSSILLLHGTTGSGKSILCSNIVDSLVAIAEEDSSTAPFGYCYCSYLDHETEDNTSDKVMRSILGQLAHDPSHPFKLKDFLCSEYERQVALARIRGPELLMLRTDDCVRLILELAEQSPLTLIIDAFDCLGSNERHKLVSGLREIVVQANNVVKILITSRYHNKAAIELAADYHIQITRRENQQDIENFVTHSIDTAISSNLLLEGKVTPDLRQKLVQAILSGAGETFLCIKLQIESLCRKTIGKDVVTTLQSELPKDLDQLYHESWVSISKSDPIARNTAIKALSWVLFARESLTPLALLTAIADSQDAMLQTSQLMSYCANLIVLDKSCNMIRFAHQSVKKFLQRYDLLPAATAHSIIASTCINAFSKSPTSPDNLKLLSDDFYAYAAMYWPVHLNMAEKLAPNPSLINNTISFVFDENYTTTLVFNLWTRSLRKLVALLAGDHVMKPILDTILEDDSGVLFLASTFGLTDLLRIIFTKVKDVDVNRKNRHGHSPVYLAAAYGHSTATTILVDNGADLNATGGKYGNPLHAACFSGHLDTVRVLLELGANISCGPVFGSALQAACRGSHENIALHLIEYGSMITSEDDYEQAIEAATRAGFVGVIKQLEQHPFAFLTKTKLDIQKKITRKAIEGGNLSLLRQHLDQQVDRRAAIPQDAVAVATLHNHKTIVDFLLDEGMDIEAEGSVGSPLRTACLLDYRPIIRLLLDRGANINANGIFGDALQAAAMRGHTVIVQLLINEGANVNQRTCFYGTALQAAIYYGQYGVVVILLAAGADMHAEKYSRDAFYTAAERGHCDIITLMLRRGYKPLYSPMYGDGPCWAHRSPYKALVRDASPSRQSNVNGRDMSSRISTTIVSRREPPMVELESILRTADDKSNAVINPHKNSSITDYEPESLARYGQNCPLEAAAFAGHVGSVQLLLEHREHLNLGEYSIDCAIKAAASRSHLTVVQLLFEDITRRQSIKSRVKAIFEREMQQTHIANIFLDMASKYCTSDELAELKQIPIMYKHGHFQELQVSQETLISDFAKSCKTGNVKTVNAILNSEHHEALSSHYIDCGLQLCALYGQSAVVQTLIECPLLKMRLPYSGEEAFVAAAASGFTGTMRLIISHWRDELTNANNFAISRALVVASENGHIGVVRYLVEEMSANVNQLTPIENIGPGLSKDYYSTSPFIEDATEHRDQLPASTEEPVVVLVISPLLAVLQGFARFEYWKRYSSDKSQNQPIKSEQPHQEEVVVFLLEHGAQVNDLGGQELYPIQFAARFCADHVVQKMISVGADVNTSKTRESALFAAAGRELSAVDIVRKLLAAGALIPEDEKCQEALLNQALRYFEGDTSRQMFHSVDDPDGHFLEAFSLQYVFTEGSGAVLFELLNRMPLVTTTDVKWGLVLQMAACLDDLPFVELLLSRGTNVNATGYYYGTPLEAAARFGHLHTVQKLLDEGADVNVLQGRWQSALRAAVIGAYADIVRTLLEYGADMNLGSGVQRLYANDGSRAVETALHLGVLSNDLNIVRILLDHGADAVQYETGMLHPLIIACLQGNLAIVEQLLGAGAPVNARVDLTPYMYNRTDDIACNHLDLTKLLPFYKPGRLEIADEGFGTALNLAVGKGHTDMVRALLAAGGDVSNSTILSSVVLGGNLEILHDLLAAGLSPGPTLVSACRQGILPMIELLLENIYDGETPETVVDNAFTIIELNDSVLELLLEFSPPTTRRFVQACAAGSATCVRSMLQNGGVDVNKRDEVSGDSPLQVAAFNLRTEVVRLLLDNGADVNSKNGRYGMPLINALEACAAILLPHLVTFAQELIDQLPDPQSKNGSESLGHEDSISDSSSSSSSEDVPISWNLEAISVSKLHHLSDCEAIVQLLLNHGAQVADSASKSLGHPLHIACLLGSKSMAELFLEQGADPDISAGALTMAPIFAAIWRGNLDIVSLLLQKTPLTNDVHPVFGTALHFACVLGNGDIARVLLENGGDVTIVDEDGQTALTKALENAFFTRSLRLAAVEIPLKAILELAKPLKVVESDLMAAARLSDQESNNALPALLDAAKDLIVPEAVICRCLENSDVNTETVKLLIQRNGGRGVTSKMLEATKTLDCMQFLLALDSATPITEEIMIRALKMNGTKHSNPIMLETLFSRNPHITITDAMLQAVKSLTDLELLLSRLPPSTRISTQVVKIASKKDYSQPHEFMRPLLHFDPTIKLDLEVIEGTMRHGNNVDTLEMVLEHDRSTPITETIFLLAFDHYYPPKEFERNRLAALMEKYKKRVVFTEKVRAAIDRAYEATGDEAKRKRFYDLELVDAGGDKS